MGNVVQNSEEFQQILKNNSSVELLKKINSWLSIESRKEILTFLKKMEILKFKIRPINSTNEWNTYIKNENNIYLAVQNDGACHLSASILKPSGSYKRKVLYSFKSLPGPSLFFSDILHETVLGIAIMKAE